MNTQSHLLTARAIEEMHSREAKRLEADPTLHYTRAFIEAVTDDVPMSHFDPRRNYHRAVRIGMGLRTQDQFLEGM